MMLTIGSTGTSSFNLYIDFVSSHDMFLLFYTRQLESGAVSSSL